MLLDCARLLENFRGTPLEKTCELLNQFDLYHLLFKQPISVALNPGPLMSSAPEDYKKWSKLCAGGSLQVCELLGERGVDTTTGLTYEKFDEYEEAGRTAGLPAEYLVFAVANFGDYYCFHMPADGSKDDRVYQWGLDEGEFVLYWDSFSDWLSEQVDSWVEMIADDELDPIGFKLEGEDG